jgi:uncharacterized membrane protein
LTVDEVLAGFLCLMNMVLVALLGGLALWTRNRFRRLQERVNQLETQAQSAQPVLLTEQTPTVTTPSPLPAVAEASDVLLAALPITNTTAHTSPTTLLAAAHDEAIVPAAPAAPPFWVNNPLVAWFTRIHLMVQIGMIVLFFGIGFLVKYAAEQGWFPLELRLASAALLGGGLAAVGWRLRSKARTYGLALIGGGIGIVYLTTFGAYYFYQLLSGPLAFAIFVLLGVAYALMALLNDAVIQAFLAVVGAFLAPLLTASEGGSHVTLFSYYAVVNVGILALAWFKSWRGLNVVSFLFTLAAGIGWGVQSYTPAYFASTEPFLLLFFAFYLTITVWFAQRDLDEKYNLLDMLLLFANPLACFTLQAALLEKLGGNWLADSALVLSFVYAGLSLLGLRRWRFPAVVQETVIFLSAFFLAISVPLLVDPHVTAAIWALLGTGLIWLGARRQQRWSYFAGVVIQQLAGLAFFGYMIDAKLDNLRPFLNHVYTSMLILSVAQLASSYQLHRQRNNWPRLAPLLSTFAMLIGLGWWFGGGIDQVARYVAEAHQLSAVVTLVALSCIAAELVGSWLDWPMLRLTLLGLLPVALLAALQQWNAGVPVLAHGGWYAWLLVLAGHGLMLWRNTATEPLLNPLQKQSPLRQIGLLFYHAGGVWLLALLCTRLVGDAVAVRLPVGAWHDAALLLVPSLLLALVGPLAAWLPWPIAGNRLAYGAVAALPLSLWLGLAACLISLHNPGDSAPLPFLPIINPLDLAMLALMSVLGLWVLQLPSLGEGPAWGLLGRLGGWLVGILAFALANAGIARAIHQFSGVPFVWSDLFNSATLQTTLALFWGVLALLLMALAHHRGQQTGGWQGVWTFGAAILGLTVLKLFLVDLANSGTVARIISFISVGLLIIVIAYFWPLPPRTRVPVPDAA